MPQSNRRVEQLKALGILLAAALLARPGCNGPSAPTPTPTPFPRAKPNATILENLPLIRSLEAASGRTSILVALGGTSDQRGIVSGGSVWGYQFAEPPLYQLHEWDVYSDGSVVFLGARTDALHLDMTEIGPLLALDSPAAAGLVRQQYGGQEYLDRYPQALVDWAGRWIGRQPVWDVQFFNLAGPPCRFNAVINAHSGELLYRNPPCP